MLSLLPSKPSPFIFPPEFLPAHPLSLRPDITSSGKPSWHCNGLPQFTWHLLCGRAMIRAWVWLPQGAGCSQSASLESPAPSARPRHHQQVIKSPAASPLPREPSGRSQEQLPVAVLSPVLPTLPTDLRYGRNGGGLSANGQLVTKPTSFLKLGHRIETGTAELSPNRTVAHLVPGPLGTPGGVGAGQAGGRSRGSKGSLKFGGWAGRSTWPQSALILSPLPSGLVQILEGGRSSPTYPLLAQGAP